MIGEAKDRVICEYAEQCWYLSCPHRLEHLPMASSCHPCRQPSTYWYIYEKPVKCLPIIQPQITHGQPTSPKDELRVAIVAALNQFWPEHEVGSWKKFVGADDIDKLIAELHTDDTFQSETWPPSPRQGERLMFCCKRCPQRFPQLLDLIRHYNLLHNKVEEGGLNYDK